MPAIDTQDRPCQHCITEAKRSICHKGLKVCAHLESVYGDPEEVGQAAERLRGANVRVVARQHHRVVKKHHREACRSHTCHPWPEVPRPALQC